MTDPGWWTYHSALVAIFQWLVIPLSIRGFTHRTASSAMAPMEPGKMGPTLVGKDVVYKKVLTDPGMFSIIYGGASGAMQSFHRRDMKQDEMLRIVA